MAAAPERIGRYRVREVIGAGGFATVYRATDDRLGVDVAVKVLAENHSLDADVRERFVEEARRLRRVAGPPFLAVHDMGETERAQPYMVLEWADRGDLSRRVTRDRQDGRIPAPKDALAVARALAGALGVLHRHSLVHRDLSPTNLLLRSTEARARPGAGTARGPVQEPDPRKTSLIGRDESLLLADLGLSKDLALASGLTVAAGTSGFAPPEQREHGGVVDHRADIWAASAVIVWLAVGRAPDDAGRWRRDLREAGWPPGAAAVLDRGLVPDPGDRFPDVEEWVAALEDALRPGGPEPGLGEEALTPAGGGPRRTRRWLTLLVPAVLAAGVWATRGHGGPTVRSDPLGGGQVRTVVEDGGVTITLDGPDTVAVGQSVQLSAALDGAEAWIWVGPDGAVATGTDTFQMEALSPGRATVRLLAVDDHGEIIEASRRVSVTGDAA
jgi:eukaryotic-like serine/threonine-protein kinase